MMKKLHQDLMIFCSPLTCMIYGEFIITMLENFHGQAHIHLGKPDGLIT